MVSGSELHVVHSRGFGCDCVEGMVRIAARCDQWARRMFLLQRKMMELFMMTLNYQIINLDLNCSFYRSRIIWLNGGRWRKGWVTRDRYWDSRSNDECSVRRSYLWFRGWRFRYGWSVRTLCHSGWSVNEYNRQHEMNVGWGFAAGSWSHPVSELSFHS